jgi:hypothetical protein
MIKLFRFAFCAGTDFDPVARRQKIVFAAERMKRMPTKKTVLRPRGARVLAAALLLVTLALSLSACSGDTVVATINENGVLVYNGVNYSPLEQSRYNTVFYDPGEAVAKVAGQDNVSVYSLRYAQNEDFLCVITPTKERTLYIADGKDLATGGRKASNILLKYKNGFVQRVEKESDFNTAISMDTIKGSPTTFSFDPKTDNLVSVFASYDANAVATVWFGTLVLKDETLIYVFPSEDARTLTETVDTKNNEDTASAKEYAGTVIEDEKTVAELQRITGLA